MDTFSKIELDRRELLIAGTTIAAAGMAAERTTAQPRQVGPQPGDRVLVTNEDSCTITVIDPIRDEVETTINFTSFDEDPRPPFRFATGGAIPTHAAMLQKPLYHGAISLHGCAPSPDSRLVACTGRGSSNVYLFDTRSLRIVGNRRNPQAATSTNQTAITSGLLVGREPHEPTFSPSGKEVWVAVRGEDRVLILDATNIEEEASGRVKAGTAIRGVISSLPGPSMVWFGLGGRAAYIASQKVPFVQKLSIDQDAAGYSRVKASQVFDIRTIDPFGFSPFIRSTTDRSEMWLTHKLADRVSCFDLSRGDPSTAQPIQLGEGARPNHIDFVTNSRGRVAFISLARVDDAEAGNPASSRIAIVDLSAPIGKRGVSGWFASRGREAHGIWSDPSGMKLYVAHELDELPGAQFAGQGVCSVFDVSNPFAPRFIRQIPLGDLELPSGRLRNKKSINLLYVRPGARSATA